MPDLTFTFTLTKPPDRSNITYEGPEDYFLEVWYGAMIGKTEFEIDSISIEKKLPEGEHEVFKKSYGESKMSSIGMNLKIDCKRTKLTQNIGEQIEVYVTGIQIVTDSDDVKKMRFTSYKISNSRQSTLYNDIKFETTYNREIDTLTCVSTIFGAPLPPPPPPPPPSPSPPSPPPPPSHSPNALEKKDTIKTLLENTDLLVQMAPNKLDTIQLINKGLTMMAHIKDNIITYPYPTLYKDKLTAAQLLLLRPVLVGGRRTPKRKATKRCLLRTQRRRKQSKRKLRNN